jgi:TPR repeat protein
MAAALFRKAAAQGRPVQVEPMKPVFEAPGSLELSARNCNMMNRLPTVLAHSTCTAIQQGHARSQATLGLMYSSGKVWRCMLRPHHPVLKAPGVSA